MYFHYFDVHYLNLNLNQFVIGSTLKSRIDDID
jgi:hypothetical protein